LYCSLPSLISRDGAFRDPTAVASNYSQCDAPTLRRPAEKEDERMIGFASTRVFFSIQLEWPQEQPKLTF
jgi:hypothetical protein